MLMLLFHKEVSLYKLKPKADIDRKFVGEIFNFIFDHFLCSYYSGKIFLRGEFANYVWWLFHIVSSKNKRFSFLSIQKLITFFKNIFNCTVFINYDLHIICDVLEKIIFNIGTHR